MAGNIAMAKSVVIDSVRFICPPKFVITLVDYAQRVDAGAPQNHMSMLFYIPVVLSLLALGAHFLRYDVITGVIVVLVLIGLLFLRKAWVPKVLQVALLLALFEWAHTLYFIAQARMAQGAPIARLVIILGTVIAITALSALLFESKTMKRIYRR
jgi:hypothetical protein